MAEMLFQISIPLRFISRALIPIHSVLHTDELSLGTLLAINVICTQYHTLLFIAGCAKHELHFTVRYIYHAIESVSRNLSLNRPLFCYSIREFVVYKRERERVLPYLQKSFCGRRHKNAYHLRSKVYRMAALA